MSSIAASAIRHLENLVKKVRKNTLRFSTNPPHLLEYLMVKFIRFGNLVEDKTILFIRRLTEVLDLIQKSLMSSIYIASLWVGLLLTVALLIMAILYMMG